MRNFFVIKVALVVMFIGMCGYFAVMVLTGGTPAIAESATQAAAITPAAGAAYNQGGTQITWAARCNKDFKNGGSRKGVCEIFQRLVVKEGNKRLVEAAIGFPKDKQAARGIFIVPLGINLESGLMVAPDGGAPFKIQIRYCTAEGCYAFADLTPAVIDVLRRSRKLTVTFQAVKGRNVNVEMSLEGFGPALDRIAA